MLAFFFYTKNEISTHDICMLKKVKPILSHLKEMNYLMYFARKAQATFDYSLVRISSSTF